MVVNAGQYTVGQRMDVWFENCAKIKVRSSSRQTYRGYIDYHIKSYIGDAPLAKLTSLDLQELYKMLLIGGRVERLEAEKIVETFTTDIFGEELKPWEESAKMAREQSS